MAARYAAGGGGGKRRTRPLALGKPHRAMNCALRLVEVFETVGGRAALTATAKDEERVALPPFDEPIPVASFWLPEAAERS